VKVSKTQERIPGVMHVYWTSFITRGDPNDIRERFGERAEWPAYEGERGGLVVFREGNDERAGGGNKGTVVKVVDDVWAKEECDYWRARTKLFEL